MTTLTADTINASTFGNPVVVKQLRINDPITVGKTLQFSSETTPIATFKTSVTQDRTYTITSSNNSFGTFAWIVGNGVGGGIKTYPSVIFTTGFGPITMGANDKTVTLKTPTIAAFLKRNINFQPQNANSTTIIKSLAPAGTTCNLTLPSNSTTLLTSGVASTFPLLQTFSSGIASSAITANTVNSDLSLSANGTGNIVVNGNVKSDSIVAKTTNGNLSILSNGTGLPSIGTTGFKFSNEAISFYKLSSFVSSIVVGTFNSGNLTFQYERIGNRVIIRVPPVTGTPSVSAVWTLLSLPAEITPVTTQVCAGGIGVKNTTTVGPLFAKVNSISAISISITNDTGSFGNTGTNGWSNSWSFNYFI